MDKKSYDSLFFSKTRDFLETFLIRQCGRSPHTVKAYRDALTVFRKYVTDVREMSIRTFSFDECARDFLLDFMEYLQKNRKARTSCNQRLAAIKAYLWYVADGDISLQQVALRVSRIPFLKTHEVERAVLSEECLASLLSAPGNSPIGIRDTTIMVVLYDTAIRLEELLKLKTSDLNLQKASPYLWIHGKGDKERIVSISDRTTEHIKRYMNYYHGASAPETESFLYTVINGHVHQMSPGNVQRLINKYAEQVRVKYPDMPLKVHPHMFRRTRATNLYQNDVELELVSRILGHSSTQTTRIYAKPSLEMLKKAMEKSSGCFFDATPIWPDNEEELAKICGLR